MRLATFETSGKVHLGAVVGDEMVDLTASMPELGDDMCLLVARHDELGALVERAVNTGRLRHPIGSISLRAPVLRPGKFYGVGMNFHTFIEAAKRLGMPVPPGPLWFSRPASALRGHEQTVWMPQGSAALDFEGEIAIVIGRACRGITAEHAPSVIAGYTICNDITVRDWAARSPILGKSYDTHAPLGPWIVTADAVGDPHDLGFKTWVNGELRQDSNTSDMVVDCNALVAMLSGVCTLRPGDVIITGTAGGCAIFEAPPRWLKAGDTVRVEFEGLGTLVNEVVVEPEH